MDLNIDVRWRITPARRFYLRSWGEEAVVFDDGSGGTHLISSHAADVLLILQEGDASLAAILGGLAPALEGAANDEQQGYVYTILSELEKLDLIERI